MVFIIMFMRIFCSILWLIEEEMKTNYIRKNINLCFLINTLTLIDYTVSGEVLRENKQFFCWK